MPLNFQLAGKRYQAFTAEVTADQIEAFAVATGDDHSDYRRGDDSVSPPVFPVVPAFRAMGMVTADPELGVDNLLMVVHGEQRFEYHRPMRAGDRLSLEPSLEAVVDRGKGATFVAKTAVFDVDGDPVVDLYATIFVRGGGSGVDRPAAPPEIESPSPGGEVARFVSVIDRDMPPRYAEVSGDNNPIHLDDDVARAVGLPGVINHGLGTLAVVSRGLVDEVAGGEVTRLRSLGCRFTAPVIPGDRLLTVISSRDDEPAHLWETTQGDGTTVLTGTIEAQ